jgi:ABC-type polysaccharide/polyol phosphate transport system ATPase subunit
MPAVKEIYHRAIWVDGGNIHAEGKPESVVDDYLKHLK